MDTSEAWVRPVEILYVVTRKVFQLNSKLASSTTFFRLLRHAQDLKLLGEVADRECDSFRDDARRIGIY